jgi:hypothetical protein
MPWLNTNSKIARLGLELTLRTGQSTMFHSDAIFTSNSSTDDKAPKELSRLFAAKTSAARLEEFKFAELSNILRVDERPKLDALEYTELFLSHLYRTSIALSILLSTLHGWKVSVADTTI